MKRCRIQCCGGIKWLKAPLGDGLPLASAPLAAGHQADVDLKSQYRTGPQMDVSLFRAVGVVKRPQVQLANGVPVFQCRLLITQVGASAMDVTSISSVIVAKDHLLLKCFGDALYAYCRKHLHDGATVFVCGDAIQRPKFVAIHSSYRYETEVHVSSTHGGHVAVVGLSQ